MPNARATKQHSRLRVLIAGGKTGGHLFPAVAIAEELERRVPDVDILFVGTKGGLEERVLPELGYPVAFIAVRPLMGVGG